jgi:exonuclease SbcD
LKILHTADWHIGRSLYGRKRYDEFEFFLNWLSNAIEKENVDALLVAGDIFDNAAPSNRAQELYYRFLRQVADSPCRHVIIIAGNHDSPSFLNAPKELLKALNVHVVGSASENPEDEVILLKDSQGNIELIACAVPYLRDRDVRLVEAGERPEDKERKLLDGIRNHYQAVYAAAEKKRSMLPHPVPLVALGHLFAAGGKTVEGDGVRDLYVGSLAHVGLDTFPSTLDYLALGHLHAPQKVAESETVRYSGSPLPMGFGEAAQEKQVLLVHFQDLKPQITHLPIPKFRELARIRGDWVEIEKQIDLLKSQEKNTWIEIEYQGEEIALDLHDKIERSLAGSSMEVLRVKNVRTLERVLMSHQAQEELGTLGEEEVFQRCLEAFQIPESQRPELIATYKEVLHTL